MISADLIEIPAHAASIAIAGQANGPAAAGLRHILLAELNFAEVLTNGHSKKVANHAHMVALYTMFYNFIRTHSKLRMSPAMAAGIADTFMGFEAILERIDAAQIPKPRGPYRKKVKLP